MNSFIRLCHSDYLSQDIIKDLLFISDGLKPLFNTLSPNLTNGTDSFSITFSLVWMEYLQCVLRSLACICAYMRILRSQRSAILYIGLYKKVCLLCTSCGGWALVIDQAVCQHAARATVALTFDREWSVCAWDMIEGRPWIAWRS